MVLAVDFEDNCQQVWREFIEHFLVVDSPAVANEFIEAGSSSGLRSFVNSRLQNS